MTVTNQFLAIKDIYEQTKKNFSPGSIVIISDINGRMKHFKEFKKGTAQEALLFIGNLIGEGTHSREIVEIAMKKNLKVLRGTAEDTIVRLLDACEDGDKAKMHLYASIFHANHGTRILLNFSGDRLKDVTKIARGKITHLGFLLQAISDGILTPEESGNIIAAALGVNVINWMRSLPVAAIFPDSSDISKISEIVIVSYGGLSSEIRQDICYSTETIAVWGAAAPARSSSKNILYHLFPESLKPDFVSRRDQMNYQGSSNYTKSAQYSVSPGSQGDSISIRQITSKYLRKQDFENNNYRMTWMKKDG